MTKKQSKINKAHGGLTMYQCAYLSHVLTLHGTVEDNITNSLASSKVDMNPHQVEAALFALRSPLSQGVILADEVGLGKTIEAGLIIAQKWAERHRKIVLIVPAMIRNQWVQELMEKFNIPSKVMDTNFYKAEIKSGTSNPFKLKKECVLICSYEFASNKDLELKEINWDLVVFDEAHKLRNVWRRNSKIAKRLQNAFAGRKKILLSATPLQNSLLELYGLVSIIDPHFFGSVDSFKANFLIGKVKARNLNILRERLTNVCIRTLRRQVTEEGGINFTRRHSIVEEYMPSDDEFELYKKISSYLQREDIKSIKPSARNLITLVIRKILASSSFAISDTLDKMINRLEKKHSIGLDNLEDFETASEFADEIDSISDEAKIDLVDLKKEIEELKSYKKLANSITNNAKGDALITVIGEAFSKVKKFGGQKKAVIFTESRRTQRYLHNLLEKNGFNGQMALLNGVNNDTNSKRIHNEWLKRHKGSDNISGSKSVDMKAAIIEEFKNNSKILISTESGAEGVNLQFCSLLINYDLPWNPQRVEQRIGRIHRYGQKCDVIVVNFVNKRNKADQLVFELLDKKFKLFEGVFGASDEILGAIESDISIERRINEILQKCRHARDIEKQFKILQNRLSEIIEKNEQKTRDKLLEHFDEDVISRLKIRKEKINLDLNNRKRNIKLFCQNVLPNAVHFDEGFEFENQAYYYEWKPAEKFNGHLLSNKTPLLFKLTEKINRLIMPPREITFNYDEYGMHLSDLRRLRGKSGWLKLSKIKYDSIDTIEKLILSAYTDDGTKLEHDQCERLLFIPANQGKPVNSDHAINNKLLQLEQEYIDKFSEEIMIKNNVFFTEEQKKLDNWEEEAKDAIDIKLKQLDKEIKLARETSRAKKSLEEKATAQRFVKKLEREHDKLKLEFFETRKKVIEKSDQLLDEIESKLELSHSVVEVFTIRWKLV